MLRTTFGLKPAPEFEAWLARIDVTDEAGRRRAIAGAAPHARRLLEAAADHAA